MKKEKSLILLWLIGLLTLSIACSADASSNNQANPPQENQNNVPADDNKNEQPEDPTPEEYQESAGTEFQRQLNSGEITIDGIQANSQYEDTFGPILTIQLTNPGTDEVIVTFPCGLVFTPSDPGNQPLMMIQPLQVTLAAGETQEVIPYVVCIDLGTSAPSFNNTYTVGNLVDVELLLKFAECICNEELSADLDSMDGIGVQFAAWTIATGGDFFQALEEDEAMAEYFEEEYGDELEEMAETLMEMMSLYGEEWLERCEIDLEQ